MHANDIYIMVFVADVVMSTILIPLGIAILRAQTRVTRIEDKVSNLDDKVNHLQIDMTKLTDKLIWGKN